MQNLAYVELYTKKKTCNKINKANMERTSRNLKSACSECSAQYKSTLLVTTLETQGNDPSSTKI